MLQNQQAPEFTKETIVVNEEHKNVITGYARRQLYTEVNPFTPGWFRIDFEDEENMILALSLIGRLYRGNTIMTPLSPVTREVENHQNVYIVDAGGMLLGKMESKNNQKMVQVCHLATEATILRDAIYNIQSMSTTYQKDEKKQEEASKTFLAEQIDLLLEQLVYSQIPSLKPVEPKQEAGLEVGEPTKPELVEVRNESPVVEPEGYPEPDTTDGDQEPEVLQETGTVEDSLVEEAPSTPEGTEVPEARNYEPPVATAGDRPASQLSMPAK